MKTLKITVSMVVVAFLAGTGRADRTLGKRRYRRYSGL